MDKKQKIWLVVLVLVGLAIAVLALLYSQGGLFQGMLRYEPADTQPSYQRDLDDSTKAVNRTLQRLESGERVDSADDDEAGLTAPIEFEFQEIDVDYEPQEEEGTKGSPTLDGWTLELRN